MNLEDQIRRTLAALAGNPRSHPTALNRAAEEAGRRMRTRRRRALAISGAVVITAALAVAAGLARSNDDKRVHVGQSESSTTPMTTPSTSAPTTPSSEFPVITGGPGQFFVATQLGLELRDGQSGAMITLLDDLSHLPPTSEGHRASGRADLAPDGTVYYGVASGPEGFPSVWRVSPQTFVPEPVLDKGGLPALSPDGQFLAYATTSDDREEGLPLDVLVVRDLAGGTERRWSGLDAAVEAVPFVNPYLTDISWSPAGDGIAFSLSFGADYEKTQVRLLDLRSDSVLGDAEPLPGNLTSPVWLADGALLTLDPAMAPSDEGSLIRFDAGAAEGVPDQRFAGLAIIDIDVDNGRAHVLARTWSGEVYILDPDGQPLEIAAGVVGASW